MPVKTEGDPLPQLRRLLTQRSDWFEASLRSTAREHGYDRLPRSVVQLFAHIGRSAVPISGIAREMGVSRQWVRMIAARAAELGLVSLETDPTDKRAMLVDYTPAGRDMVRTATVSMAAIEAELERRIGRERFEQLVALLGEDWGPPLAPGEKAGAASAPRPKRRSGDARLSGSPVVSAPRAPR